MNTYTEKQLNKKLKEQKYALDKVIQHWKSKYENEKDGKNNKKLTPDEFDEESVLRFDYDFSNRVKKYFLVTTLPVGGTIEDARDYALSNRFSYLKFFKEQGHKEVNINGLVLEKLGKNKEGLWNATWSYNPYDRDKSTDFTRYDIDDLVCPFKDEGDNL